MEGSRRLRLGGGNGCTERRMGPRISELRRLQEVELKLAAIQRNLDARTRRVTVQKNRVKQIEARLAENEAAAKAQQVKTDILTLEVNSREDSVAKHRLALNKAKTNKEYASILTAMNTEKADTSKLETSILQMMEDQGKIKAVGAQIREERDNALKDVATAEQQLASYANESKAEMDRLKADRKSIALAIDEKVLTVFDRAAQRHEGEAMATVVKLRPKGDEWACSGCNLKVTLEIINSLVTRDEVQLCGVCGRIMYLEDGAVRAPN